MDNKNYPAQYQDINRRMGMIGKEIPGPMGGFQTMHKEAARDGALGAKMKELIALGIAVAVRCDDCIAYHVHDALRSGATHDEVMEAIGVAIMMGGGPALMYALEAHEALEQFEAEGELPRS